MGRGGGKEKSINTAENSSVEQLEANTGYDSNDQEYVDVVKQTLQQLQHVIMCCCKIRDFQM